MTPAGFVFELSGGALCLDFVNTVDIRPTPERKELLNRYEDLLAWARQSGAITPRQAEVLERKATRRPREAESVLDRARAVRETLFALFSAAFAGRRLPSAELASLNRAVAAALERLRLSPGQGGRARWTWDEDPALERPLWPVLRSAAELLTSDDLARVGECAAEEPQPPLVRHDRLRQPGQGPPPPRAAAAEPPAARHNAAGVGGDSVIAARAATEAG
jgi:predicted RNA-binding Zn ribbon-like protein